MSALQLKWAIVLTAATLFFVPNEFVRSQETPSPDAENRILLTKTQEAIGRGDFEEASPSLEKILAKTWETSDDQVEFAQSLVELGVIYAQWGKYNEAARLYDAAARLATNSPLLTATVLDRQGLLFDETGDKNKAWRSFSQAWKIRSQEASPDDPDVAESLLHIASFVLDRKNEIGEEQNYLKPLDDVSPSNPEKLVDSSYWIYFTKIESFLQRALEINRKTFGETSLATARTYAALGRYYSDLVVVRYNKSDDEYERIVAENDEKAQRYFLESIGVLEEIFGENCKELNSV